MHLVGFRYKGKTRFCVVLNGMASFGYLIVQVCGIFVLCMYIEHLVTIRIVREAWS